MESELFKSLNNVSFYYFRTLINGNEFYDQNRSAKGIARGEAVDRRGRVERGMHRP